MAGKRLILIKFCGLVGFSLAAIHALMSMLLFSPIYYPKFFLEAGKTNLTAFSADAPLAIRFLFLGTGSVSNINSPNGLDVSEDSQLKLPKREEFPHVMETPPLRSGRSAQASPPLSEWRILEQFRMLAYCDPPISGRV